MFSVIQSNGEMNIKFIMLICLIKIFIMQIDKIHSFLRLGLDSDVSIPLVGGLTHARGRTLSR